MSDEKSRDVQADAAQVLSITGGEKKRAQADVVSQPGGFATHVRPDLARAAVVYLEQEDPKRRHREKIVCAVNVGDFELRYPATVDEPEKTDADGRTVRRKTWDDAVQALVRVVSEAGLNPKFVKNDKNSCKLVLKQENVASLDQAPDEFFQLELHYCSEFELERLKLEHVKKVDQFDWDLRAMRGEYHRWTTNAARKQQLFEKMGALEREKAFFLATTPDPREMDSGLIFKIEIYSLKEYGVVKQKLNTIVTNYLGALSKIAAESGGASGEPLKQSA